MFIDRNFIFWTKSFTWAKMKCKKSNHSYIGKDIFYSVKFFLHILFSLSQIFTWNCFCPCCIWSLDWNLDCEIKLVLSMEVTRHRIKKVSCKFLKILSIYKFNKINRDYSSQSWLSSAHSSDVQSSSRFNEAQFWKWSKS